MLRRTVLSLVAVLALMGLASCSSDGSDGSAGTAPTGGATTDGADRPTTTAAATDPAIGVGTPSAGCEGEALPAGHERITLRSDGQERSYQRYVPEGLEPGTPAPLVVDFPAYSPATLQEAFSGFTTEGPDGTVRADDYGAVIVTPEPTNGSGSLLTWNYVGTEGWSDDQQFVADLLDHIGAAACIDTDRVLASGFAVGATFASITACDQADRFAVLATVSGLYSPEGCAPSRAIPVISFHGTGDRFIPYDGSIGTGPAGLGLTAETTAGLVFMASREGAIASSEAWAGHDACDPEPAEEPVVDGVTRTTWSGCDDDAVVELYTLDGGEHTWPSSTGMDGVTGLLGPVSTAVDATDLIWDFFVAQTS